MKRFIKLFIAVLLSTAGMIACENGSKTTTNFSGKATDEYVEEVSLYQLKDGESIKIASSQIAEDQSYALIVEVEEPGFYALFGGNQTRLVYVEGGGDFEIDFASTETVVVNLPNKENYILSEFEHKFEELQPFIGGKSTETYKTFFPFLEVFVPEFDAMRNGIDSGNEEFDDLMGHYVDFRLERELLYFIYSPRREHPEKGSYPKVYERFGTKENFKNSRVLTFPRFLQGMSVHQIYRKVALDKGANVKDWVQWTIDDLPNDTIKGFAVLDKMTRFKSLDASYLAFMEPNREYVLLTEAGSQKLLKFEEKISKLSPGTPGFVFDLESEEGGKVNFEDLKGKYVYLDLWATWCGPCKKEIPHLKKLDEKFDDNKIVFVSISLDKPKDKEKWKNFVEEHELEGVQLFGEDAFQSPIAQHYEVQSIPRFMLFDPNGDIVSADALRPSNPELETMLNGLIK